jgi:hypothetical protein
MILLPENLLDSTLVLRHCGRLGRGERKTVCFINMMVSEISSHNPHLRNILRTDILGALESVG